MVKTVIKTSNSNWTRERPTDAVVEAYAEIVGIKESELPPDMWEMAPPQSINKLFKQSKCDSTYLQFKIGDVDIEIENDRVCVTKQDETNVDAF